MTRIGGITRRAFFGRLGAGAAGVAGTSVLGLGTTVLAQSGDASLRALSPEAFGAGGDGRTDDAGAFSALLAAAQARALPIRLERGATYAIGAASWAGIAVTLTRDLVIDGNGATLKILHMPALDVHVGSGRAVFKISAASRSVTIKNLHYDGGGFLAVAFDIYEASGGELSDCRFVNGDMGPGGSGNASICWQLNRCAGLEIARNQCDQMGYFAYCGHSDPNLFGQRLHIHHNRGTRFYRSRSSERGDFVVGVQKHGHIHHNIASGLFAGVAMGGSERSGTVSSDMDVHDNHFSDFVAAGIGTDIVGTISAARLHIHDNICTDPTPGVATAASIYLLQATDSIVRNNQGDNTPFGIVFDKGSSGVIANNRFHAGREPSPIVGLSMTGQLGTVSGVLVQDNDFQGFPANIGIGGAGHVVSNVRIVGNRTRGGARGLYIQGAVSGIVVDDNDFAGGHSIRDIDNAATSGRASVTFGRNRSRTSAGTP